MFIAMMEIHILFLRKELYQELEVGYVVGWKRRKEASDLAIELLSVDLKSTHAMDS